MGAVTYDSAGEKERNWSVGSNSLVLEEARPSPRCPPGERVGF
jgi:hypothetical protein